jgi:SulP family sulfate permease
MPSAPEGDAAPDGPQGCGCAQAKDHAAYFFKELICGVTVALAMVPEAVAFSLSAGLKPQIGLVSSFLICLVTSVLGGRPAMVSGATGSIAALIGPIVHDKGVEYLFCAVILMGVIQVVLGLLRVGHLARFLPAPVEIGFANGLALVIFFAQMGSFKVPDEHQDARRLMKTPEAFGAFSDGRPWVTGPEAAFSAVVALLAFLVSVFLPRLTERVPSALAGIAVGTAFEWAIVRAAFGHHTTLVGDLGSSGGAPPVPVWFQSSYHMPPLNLETLQAVFPLAILMSAIGLLESVMTLRLIDEHTKTKGNVVRECVGQGVANIVCGAFAGMGGCAMLGQSMINVSSGARGRLSTVCASLFLIFIILVGYPVIDILPVAALAGVMFNVVYHTFDWGSLPLMAVAALPLSVRRRCLSEERGQAKIRRADAFVILLVTAHMGLDPEDGSSVKIYHVNGVLFFGSAQTFLELFDVEKDPGHVRLVFESSYISDFSAIEALNKLGERYGEAGKRVTLQLTHPGSSKIVDKAANLLVRELRLAPESEQLLDTAHRRHRIESYGPTQTFMGRPGHPASEGDAWTRSSDTGARHRATSISSRATA